MLEDKIKRLLSEKNAVILAHNYQRPEVQDIADFAGDSLELSIKAMKTEAKVIVFAGVDFMAEQAAILNPEKKVLHPEKESTCPLAHQLTPEIVDYYRRKHPKAPLVVYVNSLASVKAKADYVVTSSSAVKIVSQLDAEAVLFGPDRNLASYVAEQTGKTVIPIPPDSHCPVHMKITVDCIKAAKEKYPRAKILVHPECTSEVRKLADFIGSTSQMVRAVGSLNAEEYVIGTEVGLLHKIRKEYPSKKAYPATLEAVCEDMKKITLEKILRALLEEKYVVAVDKKIADKARSALERSFELLGVEIPWSRK